MRVNDTGYFDRLRTSAQRNEWRALLNQLLASLWWRISPARIATRSVMRENDAFDAQHSTDTAGEVPLEQAGIDAAQVISGNGVYRAIPPLHFRAALARLDLCFDDYTFLDYGAGKGKALLLASDYPFRRIVGVEYSRVLHETASANLRLYRSPAMRSRRLEVLHIDARHYEPPDDPLVCFFFNPFDSTIWRDVLGRLQHSFEQIPRPIHIVYVNIRDVDELEDLFPEFPIFSPVAATRTLRILSAIPKTCR